MQSEQKKEFLLTGAYYAVLAAALYLFLRYLLWWLLPFLLAFAAARAMEPVILLLRRTVHFKRGFSAALLTLITVSAVRSAEDLKRLCAGAAVCVGATGAYGIVQRIQGVKVNPSYVDLKVNAGMPGRVFSIFDNPNTFAQVLLLLLPLVLALVHHNRTFAVQKPAERKAVFAMLCLTSFVILQGAGLYATFQMPS